MRRLNELPIGATTRILDVEEDAQIAGRLMDLGFTAGARAKCLYKSPAGNPRAYCVRGSVVALRNEDAARITVE